MLKFSLTRHIIDDGDVYELHNLPYGVCNLISARWTIAGCGDGNVSEE
ncbi:MAG: hypothetical protein ACOC85_05685 [Thermoplasmatota archaeon]